MGRIKDSSKLAKFEDRCFGVEIEFVAPRSLVGENSGSYQSSRSAVATAIERVSGVTVVAESYNHTTRTHWKIVNDSTARPTLSQHNNGYIGGFELVSPILKGENSINELKAILKAMRLLNLDVSRHCGLHVHHDVREWRKDLRSSDFNRNHDAMNKITNCITLTQKFEDVIYGMLPKSRKSGGWARTINSTYRSVWHSMNGKASHNKADKMKALKKYQKSHSTSASFQRDRTCGLNFHSMFRHGTVEFRYGAPTLNAEKMINWIVFTQQFVNMAEVWKSVQTPKEMLIDIKANVDLTFEKMRDTLGLTKRMCRDEFQRNCSLWIRKRFNNFHTVSDDGTVTRND